MCEITQSELKFLYCNNVFFSSSKLQQQKTRKYLKKCEAKETSALGKECEDSVEDAIDTIGDKSQSAWNRTKLTTYDAGEP